MKHNLTGWQEYRKKPVVIEAVQWDGSPKVAHQILSATECAMWIEATDTLAIDTAEGTMRADVGDWIIRGVEGEFYPCRASVFEATYEPV